MAFDRQLTLTNEKFLEMQKLGSFCLGEKFYYHELCELFNSLVLFKDLNSKKLGNYIGLTDTHLLIFQEIETDKDSRRRYSVDLRKTESSSNEKEAMENERLEETTNELQLVCYG